MSRQPFDPVVIGSQHHIDKSAGQQRDCGRQKGGIQPHVKHRLGNPLPLGNPDNPPALQVIGCADCCDMNILLRPFIQLFEQRIRLVGYPLVAAVRRHDNLILLIDQIQAEIILFTGNHIIDLRKIQIDPHQLLVCIVSPKAVHRLDHAEGRNGR
ncbi:hypothetical protein D3C75_914550 [compost metagenome]